jgi:hypothetical protein
MRRRRGLVSPKRGQERPTQTGDPLIDYLIELGGTVAEDIPTGEYLFREYQSFTRLDKRDDWFWGLAHEDREVLIEYRAQLWRESRRMHVSEERAV